MSNKFAVMRIVGAKRVSESLELPDADFHLFLQPKVDMFGIQRYLDEFPPPPPQLSNVTIIR